MGGNACSFIGSTTKGRGYDNSSPVKTKKFAEMELSLRQKKNRRHCPHCKTVISKSAKSCTFCNKEIPRRQYNRKKPAKQVDTKLYCFHCGNQVSKYTNDCPKCHSVLKTGIPGLSPDEAFELTVERIKMHLIRN